MTDGAAWISAINTLDTLILAGKKVHILSLRCKLANFTLASLVSLHYNLNKYKVELATLKISWLNWRKISAVEYFLCVGYVFNHVHIHNY